MTSELAWKPLGRITTDPASDPTPDRVDGEIRVYFARRDDQGRSRIAFKTISEEEPLRVLASPARPPFDLGPPGTFEADGHAPRWVVEAARGRSGYREDPSQAYRIGSAVSRDGLSWELRNDEVRLEHSGDAWDSVMTCYASPVGDLLFYNGNGFGATGIGVARRVDFADKSSIARDLV